MVSRPCTSVHDPPQATIGQRLSNKLAQHVPRDEWSIIPASHRKITNFGKRISLLFYTTETRKTFRTRTQLTSGFVLKYLISTMFVRWQCADGINYSTDKGKQVLITFKSLWKVSLHTFTKKSKLLILYNEHSNDFVNFKLWKFTPKHALNN